jgi:chromate reductase, NAD(P)H dehydrogenase (quinone)
MAWRVLAISGSLRKGSFNTALLRAAVELAPPSLTIEVAEIRDLQLYDADVEHAGLPPAVVALRERVAAADALLLATPEYNYSLSGALKNAIDWISRPPQQPFDGKPLGIVGASGGPSGTLRAQYHLRQIAVFVNLLAMARPELFVRDAPHKFDAAGRLTDEPTRQQLQKFLVAFAGWIEKLRR